MGRDGMIYFFYSERSRDLSWSSQDPRDEAPDFIHVHVSGEPTENSRAKKICMFVSGLPCEKAEKAMLKGSSIALIEGAPQKGKAMEFWFDARGIPAAPR
jgi:hypothetical protein